MNAAPPAEPASTGDATSVAHAEPPATAASTARVPPKTPKARRLTRDQRRDILLMRRLGYTYTNIAKTLSVSERAVQYTCEVQRATPQHDRAGRRPRHLKEKAAAAKAEAEAAGSGAEAEAGEEAEAQIQAHGPPGNIRMADVQAGQPSPEREVSPSPASRSTRAAEHGTPLTSQLPLTPEANRAIQAGTPKS